VARSRRLRHLPTQAITHGATVDEVDERRNRQYALGLVLLFLLFIVTSLTAGPAFGRSSFISTQRTPTYAQLCQDEGSVCNRFTTGSVPLWLIRRPLHFPTVRTARTCPVSRGKVIGGSFINGVVFGPGPVRLLLAMENSSDLLAGNVDLLPSDAPGWFAFKTTWIVAPSYQGPIIVRAKRIDGPGEVALLGGALPGPLVVPPGPTINDFSRNRTAPVGTYVLGPGCFAFQIDGKGFDEHIVVNAIGSAAR
jgi:hypothetical protein